VPTQIVDLVQAKLVPPTSLRVVVVGGGHLDSGIDHDARALGWPVVVSYGMTETASQIATGEGLPLIEGWEARVGEDEVLEVKGQGLLSGIITEEKKGFHFRDPKVDGWFRTSDRAALLEGKITLLGRADRRVKILGELVDLDALEAYWTNQTGAPAVILTRPDERRGFRLYLFLTSSFSAAKEINSSLSGPERAESIKYMQKFPLTPLGKVDRLMMTKIYLV
jgi:O-succinylbenzoic acid--CoA ligase